MRLEESLIEIYQKKRGLTFVCIERKTPVLKPALQLNQSYLCSLHRSKDSGEGGADGHVISIKTAADGRRERSRRIIDEKRENSRKRFSKSQKSLLSQLNPTSKPRSEAS